MADVAAAQFISPNAAVKRPVFDGTELSVILVRSAVGPNAQPGLEYVRFAEIASERGPVLVRASAPFVPVEPDASVDPRDEVLRAGRAGAAAVPRAASPIRGRTASGSRPGRPPTELPSAIRVTVRNAVSGEVLTVSSAVKVHVTAPALCANAQAQNCKDLTATLKNARYGEQPRRAECPGAEAAVSAMPVNRPIRACSDGGERGFIIVAVLWIMLALATLASIYATYVVRTAYAVGPSDDRVNAEALFNAALELTAYRLSVGAKEERPSHGRFNFRLGRATVVEEFHSESGRIDLNGAPKPLLANLFVMLGAKPEDGAQFADRIIGWRTAAPQNGAPDPEADAYRTAGRNYKPRGAPFQEVGELWLVLGLPPAWVERVMPYVTVYGGGAQVNILDAPPLVLAALGIAPEQVNAVLAQRDMPGVDAQGAAAIARNRGGLARDGRAGQGDAGVGRHPVRQRRALQCRDRHPAR